ncbi:MAG: nucleotidyltransferase domain-containing protein [Candidatus Woesearchaeota archaeon]
MEQISYNILQELFKRNNHIRSLSNILNINHMTISRKIKELENQNIVDFKKEGKNKVYFIKDSIEAKEKLMMMEHYKLINLIKNNPRLRKIINEIKKLNLEIAIIFGSYTKNTNTNDSDIDLYINESKYKKKLSLLDTKLSIKTGEFDKNNLLIKEIIKNHVIIKGVEKFYESIH